MKRRPKCELITVSEYDGTPVVVYEDNLHKYVKGKKGHYSKVRRKTCSECGKTALWVGIFKYPKHNRVERFCNDHAANYARVPISIPPIPQQEQEQALPKWTNMKVII